MKHTYLFGWMILCLFSIHLAQAQSFVLKGTLKDNEGHPLIGANVFEKGTSNGTSTDVNGNYELTCASKNAVIIFSYIGFAQQEIALKGQSQLNVTLQEGNALEGVEIVGSRSLNRTALETPVAIDLINVQEVSSATGQLDINQLLQYAAPSFNANRQSGSDGSDHIDPATLRGLGPDQTLVLINGKRRHQSSLINIFGTRGRGNTGTDLNTIPAAAIERIEILRDGAAAQYGSDAIAGVINIVLKSSTDEFTGNVNTGIRQAKYRTDADWDGQTVQMNGNYGTRLGGKGFVNVTVDFLTKEKTNRPADGKEFSVYRRQYGDASSDNFSTYFNSKIDLDNVTHFYAFGGYNYRDTDAYAWTRDTDSERNVTAIYPNGFDPHIQSRINDKSFSAGIKSKFKGWDVDFNNTFGVNRFHYYIDQTLNASLLEQSPTRFDAGGFQLSQNTTGLYFTRYFKEFMQGINVAFGAEYRLDNYQIFAGEEGSYRNYGIVDTLVNGVVTPVDVLQRPAGSQGFPGFRPSNELNESRSNVAAYLDVELDVTKKWMVATAVRLENYSDFGNTLNAKLATRFELLPNVALRASASTGFRAPSLAQIYFNTTFTDFAGGTPVDKIIASNNSVITRTLGISKLKQETAFNASAGITATFGNWTATVDGYYVGIQDRIVLTGAFEDTDPDIGAQLQTLGVGAAQFFTNALDTKTMGIDMVLTYTQTFGAHRFSASFAGNLNNMELGDINTSPQLAGKEAIYFGAREQKFLLASAPESKLNATLDYKFKKIGLNLRVVRFGQVVLIDWLDTEDVYEARITTDASIRYQLSKNLSITAGGSNIFNVYPTEQDTETESGGLWDSVQMGSNGALFFAKLGIKF